MCARRPDASDSQLQEYWQRLRPAVGMHGAEVQLSATATSSAEDTASASPALPPDQVPPEMADVDLRKEALRRAVAWQGYYRMTQKDREEDMAESQRKRDPAFFGEELTEILMDEALHELVVLRQQSPQRSPLAWWMRADDAMMALPKPPGDDRGYNVKDFVF